MKPTLVVLAAGIGSRYGSLKQMDQVGPAGETIMDYSLFDARRAGFGRCVFIIRRSIERDFRDVILAKLSGRFEADYIFQEIEDVPPGFSVPADRTKPWGTSHAVLAAASKVREPFAVINADDYYGVEPFRTMAEFLSGLRNEATDYSLIGYDLAGTLSEHGSVARGVCEVNAAGFLEGIVERTRIERTAAGAVFVDEDGRNVTLPAGKTVSMNFWGFTPTYFDFARTAFVRFLEKNAANPKAELYIPLVINALVRDGAATCRVLPTSARWFGVTYREDKPRVIEALAKLVEAGVYPPNLWA
jgi:hypothetical protein